MRLFLIILLLNAPSLLRAAGVTQVKGNKAIVELSGLDGVSVGDELYAADETGKRTAIMKVTQVKGDKALVNVTRGKAGIGHDVTLKEGSKPLSREVRDTDLPEDDAAPARDYGGSRRTRTRYTGQTWGVLGGLLQTNMTAKFTAGSGVLTRDVSTKMKGSSYGVLGYYDYPFNTAFQIRGMVGMEQLTATGTIDTADCQAGTTCDFKASYLSTYGLAKFNYVESPGLRLWVGLHYGFLIAMSKSSTVLNTSQISTNQIYGFSTGAEFPAGRGAYIPVTLDYGMFPKSDTVDANIMAIRVGYGWLL